MALQGKCEKDMRRFIWSGHDVPISLMFCPLCGNQLAKTSHFSAFMTLFGQLTVIPNGYTLKNLHRA